MKTTRQSLSGIRRVAVCTPKPSDYGYQADCDGERGEIQFDFESGTGSIVRLAEWDTMVSKMFAEQAIKYIRACDIEHPPQKLLFSF